MKQKSLCNSKISMRVRVHSRGVSVLCYSCSSDRRALKIRPRLMFCHTIHYYYCNSINDDNSASSESCSIARSSERQFLRNFQYNWRVRSLSQNNANGNIRHSVCMCVQYIIIVYNMCVLYHHRKRALSLVLCSCGCLFLYYEYSNCAGKHEHLYMTRRNMDARRARTYTRTRMHI